MYNCGEIIQIDEDHRLRIEVDEFSESPLDWGWGDEVFCISDHRRMPGDDWDHGDGSLPDFIMSMITYKSWTWEQVERMAHLWLVYNGYENKKVELREYHASYSRNWGQYLVVSDKENRATIWDPFVQWLDGDVYGVILEKRTQWTNGVNDDTMDTWDEVESLWGNYLDETYNALAVAREYFNIEIKEEN